MREQLAHVQTIITDCPVRTLTFLLHLTLMSIILPLAKRDRQIPRQLNFVICRYRQALQASM